jgi:hypothetical protein
MDAIANTIIIASMNHIFSKAASEITTPAVDTMAINGCKKAAIPMPVIAVALFLLTDKINAAIK